MRWTTPRSWAAVIVTHAIANVVAAKQATSVIPIVFAAVTDPLGNNLVASLAQPGGNVTGSAALTTLTPKKPWLPQESNSRGAPCSGVETPPLTNLFSAASFGAAKQILGAM
jgi:hypothetical protein